MIKVHIIRTVSQAGYAGLLELPGFMSRQVRKQAEVICKLVEKTRTKASPQADLSLVNQFVGCNDLIVIEYEFMFQILQKQSDSTTSWKLVAMGSLSRKLIVPVRFDVDDAWVTGVILLMGKGTVPQYHENWRAMPTRFIFGEDEAPDMEPEEDFLSGCPEQCRLCGAFGCHCCGRCGAPDSTVCHCWLDPVQVFRLASADDVPF